MSFHLAHLGDVLLFFQDEALVRFHPLLSRTWSRIGERKEIGTADDHGKSAVFGSVNPFTGEVIHTYANSINQEGFLAHMDQLKQKHPGRIFLIVLDNCKSHFTKKVQKFLEANKNFFLLFLPPYSPDLNVIERLWHEVRKNISNNFLFRSLEEVKEAVGKYLDVLTPDEVKKICAI